MSECFRQGFLGALLVVLVVILGGCVYWGGYVHGEQREHERRERR